MPYFEGALIVNGAEVLSKRQQDLDFSLVTEIGVDLSTSDEGLDDILVACKDHFALQC